MNDAHLSTALHDAVHELYERTHFFEADGQGEKAKEHYEVAQSLEAIRLRYFAPVAGSPEPAPSEDEREALEDILVGAFHSTGCYDTEKGARLVLAAGFHRTKPRTVDCPDCVSRCEDCDCRLSPNRSVYHEGCDGIFCAHGVCQECGSHNNDDAADWAAYKQVVDEAPQARSTSPTSEPQPDHAGLIAVGTWVCRAHDPEDSGYGPAGIVWKIDNDDGLASVFPALSGGRDERWYPHNLRRATDTEIRKALFTADHAGLIERARRGARCLMADAPLLRELADALEGKTHHGL